MKSLRNIILLTFCIGVCIGLKLVRQYEFAFQGYTSRAYFPLPLRALGSVNKCALLCTNQTNICRGFFYEVWNASYKVCSYSSSWFLEFGAFTASPIYNYYQYKSLFIRNFNSCSEAYYTLKNYMNDIVNLVLPNGTVIPVLCTGTRLRIQLNTAYSTAGKFSTRKWIDYKKGFGDIFSSYWIGNDILNILTTSANYQMQFCIRLNSSANMTELCLSYNNVTVNSEIRKYQLVLGALQNPANYSSLDISDQHNNSFFTTSDVDNDNNATGNCATNQGGGFWYNNCFSISPNGVPFMTFNISHPNGIIFPAYNGLFSVWYQAMYLVRTP